MITTHSPIKTRKRVSSLFTSVPLGDGPKVAQSSEHHPSQSSLNPLTPSTSQIFNLQTIWSFLTLLVIPKTRLQYYRLVQDCVSKSTQLSECPNQSGGDCKDIRQHEFGIYLLDRSFWEIVVVGHFCAKFANCSSGQVIASLVLLRDGWCHQNGWIFGKVPKGGGGIFNPKIYIARMQGCDKDAFRKYLVYNHIVEKSWDAMSVTDYLNTLW